MEGKKKLHQAALSYKEGKHAVFRDTESRDVPEAAAAAVT